MSKATRPLLFAAVGVVLTIALGSVAAIGWRAPDPVSAAPGGPLAVVLLPDVGGSTLVVIDLRAGTVARRIALRSTATDIAVDASSGLVVGAQSGGFGPDVDRAASLTDVRTGEVRYVELPVIDPGDVACAGGRAFLLHSVVEASGTVFSVVDVGAARVTATGNVPGPPGQWASAGGAVWTTGEAATGAPVLLRIGQWSLSVSPFALGSLQPMGLAESAGHPVVLGSDAAGARAAAVDPLEGSLDVSVSVAGLLRAPRRATQVGGRLVVGDWSGDEPEGRSLRMLEATSLSDLGPVSVDGVPCALAAWGERLLVVDRKGGRLLVIDPESGRMLSAIPLGETDLVFSEVVVLEGGS
jgi:hypothetical protein